jgi:hypothetical protein
MQQAAAEQKRLSVNASNAAYRLANPEKVRAWNLKYRVKNAERFRQSQRDYKRKRYHSDPDYRLLCQLKARLSKAVGRGRLVTAAVKMCGCTPKELREKLEEQFLEGMSWEERAGWHIDHIYPLCAIDPSDRVQVLAANNWRNLRPARPIDNWTKSGSVTQEATSLFSEICDLIRKETNAPEV